MGIISTIGGIASAVMGKKSADKATASANQGFRYLQGNEGVDQAQSSGLQAGANVNALLGLGGDVGAAEGAFNQFKESTGYQFRMNEGMGAITGSAAAKGLLNSGATAKGLTEFGQNFASNEFGNYLNTLMAQQGQGLNAAYNVASQGTSGGAQAAQYHRQGAVDVGTGLASAAGGVYDMYKNGMGL